MYAFYYFILIIFQYHTRPRLIIGDAFKSRTILILTTYKSPDNRRYVCVCYKYTQVFSLICHHGKISYISHRNEN